MSDDPKNKVIAAALSCFAAKGYAATTMVEIEAAAGLAPGAGGTYRHFRSKRAILDAVIDATVEQPDEILAPAPVSLQGAARDALANLDRQRELLGLLRRDLDQFPELQQRVVDRLIAGPIRIVAERTTAVAPHLDAEAVATLMLGALINFHQMETVMRGRPGGLPRERIVAAWADLYRSIVTTPAPQALPNVGDINEGRQTHGPR
jgi:AcrR family transcriptional regulator